MEGNDSTGVMSLISLLKKKFFFFFNRKETIQVSVNDIRIILVKNLFLHSGKTATWLSAGCQCRNHCRFQRTVTFYVVKKSVGRGKRKPLHSPLRQLPTMGVVSHLGTRSPCGSTSFLVAVVLGGRRPRNGECSPPAQHCTERFVDCLIQCSPVPELDSCVASYFHRGGKQDFGMLE